MTVRKLPSANDRARVRHPPLRRGATDGKAPNPHHAAATQSNGCAGNLPLAPGRCRLG